MIVIDQKQDLKNKSKRIEELTELLMKLRSAHSQDTIGKWRHEIDKVFIGKNQYFFGSE